MGATRDDFIKYPRTPHLFGSKGTDDDKHLSRQESEAFIADPSLIVEEKIDGTNVGIHFTVQGRMVLQCRGHEITERMHTVTSPTDDEHISIHPIPNRNPHYVQSRSRLFHLLSVRSDRRVDRAGRPFVGGATVAAEGRWSPGPADPVM